MSENKGKAKGQRKTGVNSLRVKDRTFTHMNGNQLVSVGVCYYQTGEIKGLCCMPVNTLLDPILTPLVMDVRSETLILDEGINRELVQDIFSDWVGHMKMPYGKKVILLVWDAVRFDREFRELVDTEFEYTVHGYKCLQQIAHFRNDLAIESGNPAPYPKNNLLSSAGRALGDEYMEDCRNDAGYRALLTAKLYNILLKEKRTMWG